jgi:hypothetical protein
MGCFLIGRHKAAVASHIGGQDRGQFTMYAFFGHLVDPRTE